MVQVPTDCFSSEILLLNLDCYCVECWVQTLTVVSVECPDRMLAEGETAMVTSGGYSELDPSHLRHSRGADQKLHLRYRYVDFVESKYLR